MKAELLYLLLIFFLVFTSLANAAPHTFTIEEVNSGPDTTPPSIISTDPPNNSINVPANKNIVITFDETISSGANYAGIVLKRSAVTVSSSNTIAGNALTISPNALLSFGENYSVQMPADAISDSAGNGMTGAYSFGFATSAVPSSAVFRRINISVRNKFGGVVTNTRVRLYNNTHNIIPESLLNSINLSKESNLEDGRKYSIEYNLPKGQILRIKNLNVTKNLTLAPQFTDNYTGYVPSSTTPSSYAVALDDSELNYDSAEIILPLDDSANAIMHCISWDYVDTNCTNWDIWMLSEYAHFINSTHLSFNVSSFDAYMAGYYTAPPSCSDGIQNGDETGIDCGGLCPSCDVPPPPAQSSGGSGGGGGGSSQGLQFPETVKYATLAKIIEYPREIKISIGSAMDFTIIIKNTGNSAMNDLYLESNSEWFKFDNRSFSLNPNEIREIPVKLSIPSFAKEGPYSASFSVNGDAKDAVSFTFTVTSVQGVSSMATIDIEIVKKGIEDVKRRILLYEEQGYNMTIAKDFASKAENAFTQGDIISSMDYLSLANDALDKTVNNTAETKTFLISYVLAGVIIVLLVLIYYFYGKYKEEQDSHATGALITDTGKETVPLPDQQSQRQKIAIESNSYEKQESSVQNTSSLQQQKQASDQEANVDDMIKRLEEIRKRVNGNNI